MNIWGHNLSNGNPEALQQSRPCAPTNILELRGHWELPAIFCWTWYVLFFSRGVKKRWTKNKRVCVHRCISNFPGGVRIQAAPSLHYCPVGLQGVVAWSPSLTMHSGPPVPVIPMSSWPGVWGSSTLYVSFCLYFSQNIFLCILDAINEW
jgi:hypothetical protein